jgi:hypothetical protein
MKRKVAHFEAVSQAKSEIAGDNLDDRPAALEKEYRTEQRRPDLKAKRGVRGTSRPSPPISSDLEGV